MVTFVTPAIPASQTVNVIPSVVPAGGGALDLLGLLLTQSTRPPVGRVLSFVDEIDVADYFGSGSQEAALATIYFQGPNNATALPGQLLVAQYPVSAVAGYLRSGNVSGLSLTQLQAINGNLTLTIDGTPATQAVNLSAATSFSNAGEIIAGDFSIKGPSLGTLTASLATTVMTVTVALTFVLPIGAVVTGTGIGSNVYVAAYGTCNGQIGSTGTITLSTSVTTESAETITAFVPAVSYDSVLGAFTIISGTTGASSSVAFATGPVATSLSLTSALGAVVSPGSAAQLGGEVAYMNAIIAITQNWLSFWTTWIPPDANIENFATWTNGALNGNRFRYVEWDNDVLNTEVQGPSAPWSFITSGNLSGTVRIHANPAVDTTGQIAAFMASWAASLNFQQTNGAQTADFKSQSGLQPQVFTGGIANYIAGYGGNYYGDNTTANSAFVYYAPGAISGPFEWDDDYCFQVWLNNQFQLTYMELLTSIGRVPFNAVGDSQLYGALVGPTAAGSLDGEGPINQAVRFGMIQAGVNLSAEQIVTVNTAAGLDISAPLFNQGWYLQIVTAPPAVRAARGPKQVNFWYTTGESVQRITMNSIEVQ